MDILRSCIDWIVHNDYINWFMQLFIGLIGLYIANKQYKIEKRAAKEDKQAKDEAARKSSVLRELSKNIVEAKKPTQIFVDLVEYINKINENHSGDPKEVSDRIYSFINEYKVYLQLVDNFYRSLIINEDVINLTKFADDIYVVKSKAEDQINVLNQLYYRYAVFVNQNNNDVNETVMMDVTKQLNAMTALVTNLTNYNSKIMEYMDAFEAKYNPEISVEETSGKKSAKKV